MSTETRYFPEHIIQQARDLRAASLQERLTDIEAAVTASHSDAGGSVTARAENATAQLLMGSGGILDEKSSASTDTSHRAPVSDSSVAASAASNCSAENDLNTLSTMKPTSLTVEQLLEKFYRLFPPVVPINDANQADILVHEWRQALAGLDEAEARAAARLWCSTGHRFPVPADILACANTISAVKALWPDAHFPPLT